MPTMAEEGFTHAILFPTIRDLISAEMLCIGADVQYQIAPVPSYLSSDCGMCIQLHEAQVGEVAVQLVIQKLPYRVEPLRPAHA